jgi:uncharacterized membrane protein
MKRKQIIKQGSEPAFAELVSKGRLEFLFDGIFAIAMTILVLELKVPELADRLSNHELGTALLHHGRAFFSYILSFIVLSIFWITHNWVYAHIRKISISCLCIHVWLLMVAAFLPFCAHMLGKYGRNSLAVQIYCFEVIAYMFGILVLILIAWKQKLFDPEMTVTRIKKMRRLTLLVLLIWIVYFVIFGILRPWR